MISVSFQANLPTNDLLFKYLEYAARKSNTTHSDLAGIVSDIQIVPFMMNHGNLDPRQKP